MRKLLFAFALAAALVLVGVSAQAEDGYNAQLFWPSIFGGNFLAIEDSHTLCRMGFGGGLYLNYANGPVELRPDFDEDPEYGILNQLLTTDLVAAFGPVKWLSIGVDVPLHLMARGRTFEDLEKGTDMSELTSEFSMGDIRAELKFRVLEQQKHWLGLAVAPYATFPTGDAEMFLGEGRITGGGNLILEHDFRVFNIALNGGYLYRGDSDITNVTIGDAWKAGLGISRDFSNGFGFSVESWGSWRDSGSNARFQANPIEVIGTLRYKFGANKPRIIGGGGAGLTSGVGSPNYRLLAGADLFYCAPPKPVATQGELIVKVVDENNKPLEAKLNITGPQKFDVGTDQKGIWESPKVNPGEYTATASKDGYQPNSEKGVVEVGRTTKITIVLTKIPTTLQIIVTDKYTGEKLDSQVLFDQGTPNEKLYTIPGGDITNPWKPGDYKMIVSSKGYEDVFTDVTVIEGQANVKHVQLRKIIPTIDNIYFDFDSDVIRKESYPVLDDVVAKINALGKFKRIIVQGHCSAEGTDEYNMNLSRRRAQSVKNYLVKKGIDPAKIEIEPYGESKPLATNDTEEGRARNRRVMFIIEE